MISTQRRADGTLEVLNGNLRLNAQIDLFGRAEVMDIGTGQIQHVYAVNGQLLAISAEAQAQIERVATAALKKAKG